MTSININLKSNSPFLLKPVGKDYLWGGNRLNEDFAKGINMSPLAETWECSTHPDGESIIASGLYKGMKLGDVIKKFPEYLGTHPAKNNGLPILIKFIDAKKDLSVQVHPDDDYAAKNENGSLGKTEMWYVLDASKDAKLIYGFYHDMNKQTLKKSLNNGTVERYLKKVPIKKDDIFFIEAGCVHAIGAGALIAEIQESSNITYRMYDYKRVDKDGNERQLHIEKALDVAKLSAGNEPRQPMRVFGFKNGFATEMLCRCKYFQVERMFLNTECCREMASLKTGSNSFQVLLCTDGCGVIFWEEDKVLKFCRGDCIFIPADSVEMKLHGTAKLLKINC